MERIIKNIDYTDVKLKKSIRELKKKYPFMDTFSIGQSCMGREILALKIGKSKSYILFTGAIRGSEGLTTTLLLKFCEELCFALQNNTSVCGMNIKKLMENRGIIIVPRVNPDGCEISLCGAAAAGAYVREIRRISCGDTLHWNSNLRGVDISHNFPADWYTLRNAERSIGIYGPSKENYGGAFPESEPETAALTGLCRKVNITRAFSFSLNGKVIYSDFSDKISVRSDRLSSLMSEVSGYAVDSKNDGVSGGSFAQWFYETFNKPAFNVKIGEYETPVSYDKTEELYSEIKKLMVISFLS